MYNAKANEASKRYRKAHIKRLTIDFRFEEYDAIKNAAVAHGEPVNTYVKGAIRERMEREGLQVSGAADTVQASGSASAQAAPTPGGIMGN